MDLENQIVINDDTKRYINKSYLYLLPAFNLYPEEFTNKMKHLSICTVTIGDVFYKKQDQYQLLVLVNKKFSKDSFFDLVDWFIKNKYMEGFYPFCLSHYTYVLVFNIPKRAEKAYENFMYSKYSKMYEGIVDKVIKFRDSDTKNQRALKKRIYNVLTKDPLYRTKFEAYINNILCKDTEGSPIILDDDSELESQIIMSEEILQEYNRY